MNWDWGGSGSLPHSTSMATATSAVGSAPPDVTLDAASAMRSTYWSSAAGRYSTSRTFHTTAPTLDWYRAATEHESATVTPSCDTGTAAERQLGRSIFGVPVMDPGKSRFYRTWAATLMTGTSDDGAWICH